MEDNLEIKNLPEEIWVWAYKYPKEFPEGWDGSGFWRKTKVDQYPAVKYVRSKE